jgi:hypothetical protein
MSQYNVSSWIYVPYLVQAMDKTCPRDHQNILLLSHSKNTHKHLTYHPMLIGGQNWKKPGYCKSTDSKMFFLEVYTGCPKKMPPILFCGTTSLPVMEYSNFFIFFINEHITLIVAFFRTKIFNRSPCRVT